MEIIRQGEVSSIDVKNGKARVIFIDRDNKVSDWLSLLVPFSESHSDNYNLSVGQTVLVLSLPDMPEQGYILGCPMRKSSISDGEVKRTFSDGGFYSYHNGTLTLNPVSAVVINANTTFNGNVSVNGNVSISGDNEVSGNVSIAGNNEVSGAINTSVGISKSGVPYIHP